ncbi:hypothetical protein ACTNEO_18290 [Gracilibacillus sp. HCP3S3_G5_1]|uniref:hypothetical protein n=1 Tax=unclassified Gracilibacillus TaxID=2625209 RepID=UPI003F8C96BF
MKNKTWICSVILGVTLFLPTVVLADAEVEELERSMIELEEDVNHTETIEKAQQYIEEYLADRFAGLYIDREGQLSGVVVLMFTEPIAEEHQQALEGFAEQPEDIKIREVDYTEDQLIEKQKEIDDAGFEYDNFTIYHTSIDIINGKVVIGIDALNEDNRQFLYDKYGEELVEIVEGEQATTLEMTTFEADMENDIEVTTQQELQEEEQEEERNFFQKIIDTIKGWFS